VTNFNVASKARVPHPSRSCEGWDVNRWQHNPATNQIQAKQIARLKRPFVFSLFLCDPFDSLFTFAKTSAKSHVKPLNDLTP
jgi:hypothetical protein